MDAIVHDFSKKKLFGHFDDIQAALPVHLYQLGTTLVQVE